jgi:hypothetical protein
MGAHWCQAPSPRWFARWCDVVFCCVTLCVCVGSEKAVFHTLNLFEPYMQGMLRGQAWVLKDSLPQVNEAVARTHQHAGTCVCVRSARVRAGRGSERGGALWWWHAAVPLCDD